VSPAKIGPELVTLRLVRTAVDGAHGKGTVRLALSVLQNATMVGSVHVPPDGTLVTDEYGSTFNAWEYEARGDPRETMEAAIKALGRVLPPADCLWKSPSRTALAHEDLRRALGLVMLALYEYEAHEAHEAHATGTSPMAGSVPPPKDGSC
jgi:hypothetical protein